MGLNETPHGKSHSHHVQERYNKAQETQKALRLVNPDLSIQSQIVGKWNETWVIVCFVLFIEGQELEIIVSSDAVVTESLVCMHIRVLQAKTISCQLDFWLGSLPATTVNRTQPNRPFRASGTSSFKDLHYHQAAPLHTLDPYDVLVQGAPSKAQGSLPFQPYPHNGPLSDDRGHQYRPHHQRFEMRFHYVDAQAAAKKG